MQEKVLKKQLADQHSMKTRLIDELARLVKLARTSDRPPKALLDDMGELEKQQLAVLESIACLEKRMDGLQAQVGSIEEERGLIAKLAQATNERSRLRLRQLIRRRVARIDLFPRGSCGRKQADAPAHARRKPCFKIHFVDDLVSGVLLKPQPVQERSFDRGFNWKVTADLAVP